LAAAVVTVSRGVDPLRSGVVPRRLTSLAVTGAAVLAIGLAACDTDDGRSMEPPDEGQRVAMPTTTSSTSTTLVPGLGDTLPPVEAFVVSTPWISGGAIDTRYSCDGEGVAPALRWTAPPAGAVELAIVVSDDNAPDFVHWAVAGIAPAAGEVTEGATIADAIEGRNSAGSAGWTPPCPPPGETHTYRVTVYALSQQSELPDGFTGVELETLAFDTLIDSAESIGTYTRATAAADVAATTVAPVSTS
jgi:Raf kinase inhibitor-like YbhB/YbcL family protein